MCFFLLLLISFLVPVNEGEILNAVFIFYDFHPYSYFKQIAMIAVKELMYARRDDDTISSLRIIK